MREEAVFTFVRCSDITENAHRAAAQTYEPGMSKESRALHQEFGAHDARQHQAFLDAKIARDPRDILSHCKRIMARIDGHKSDACFGALVDLNIALGSKGLELRKSLLAQAKNVLSDPQRVFLYHHLEKGLTSSDDIAGLQESLLSDNIQGTTEFVTYLSTPTSLNSSRLDQAIASRQAGDNDAARALLERVVLKDPGHVTATMELLSLYQDEQLVNAFRNTYAQLFGRRIALPDFWEKLDGKFSKQHINERT